MFLVIAARRRAQIGVLRAWLDAETGPWVAGGDLNLTPHDPLYGALVGGDVRDAYASCGRWAGWTWPNGILPLIRLDHVLHGTGVGCVAVEEGAGSGSDHRPVIADLVQRTRDRLGPDASVMIDAFVVRMTLVPAIMFLLGDRAWWMPKWLDRVLPNVDIEGASLPARSSDAPSHTNDAPAEATVPAP